jgi:hypothetical protein
MLWPFHFTTFAVQNLNLNGAYANKLDVKCDEYSLATVHYMTLCKYSLRIPIRAFSQDGRILVGTSLRHYCKGADATVRPVPPGT